MTNSKLEEKDILIADVLFNSVFNQGSVAFKILEAARSTLSQPDVALGDDFDLLSRHLNENFSIEVHDALARIRAALTQSVNAQLVEALRDAEPCVWDACSNYHKTGMFKSLYDALEKHHKPIMEAISAAEKAGV